MNAPRQAARPTWRAALAGWALGGASALAAVFQSGSGRFEVTAPDAGAAQYVATLADEAWRALAAPLELPPAFPSPVFVRVSAAAEWGDPAPFHTIVEAGGIVTLRLPWGPETRLNVVRRALVQSLLMRLAVAHHGVHAHLQAPLWLELGGVGWWVSRADGAQLDGLKEEAARTTPPSLAALLTARRGERAEAPASGGPFHASRLEAGATPPEPSELAAGATWLFSHLQAEAHRGAEWRTLLRSLLNGEEPLAALAAAYPGRFADERERELWWLTGFHHARRGRTLPALTARESRAAIEALSRFVLESADGGHDRVAPLATVAAHGQEPFLMAELRRRSAELGHVLPSLHPFFRNAGLSLAAVFERRSTESIASFERDWRDAVELQAATAAALDALENRPRR